jgi:hypothetical protein
MNRTVIAAVIVLLWAAMAALLLQRQGWFETAPSNAAPPMAPADSWMGIYLPGDVPLGFVHYQRDVLDDGGWTLQITGQLALNLFGQRAEMALSGSGVADEQGRLRKGDMTIRAGSGEDGAQKVRILVEPEGPAEDAGLRATVETGGEAFPMDFTPELLSVAGGSMPAAMPPLEPGETVHMEVVDPVSLEPTTARVESREERMVDLAGERIPVQVVVIETAEGTRMGAWIDDQGEVVRFETPIGFILQRIAPENAMDTLDGGSPDMLLSMTKPELTGERPFRGAGRMHVRLLRRGAGEDEVEEMIIEPPDALPEEGATAPEGFLAGDPFIQSDHPRIRSQAERIVGDAQDVRGKALRVYDWVYENLEKVPVASLPSALETLEARQGDCNEHSVLYAALARAVGVPTRIAVGLVWSDELDGFYYHAWPEVWLDGWVGMDPTLGQPVADATHIRLLTGGVERWPQLLPYLGGLQIEVVSIQ